MLLRVMICDCEVPVGLALTLKGYYKNSSLRVRSLTQNEFRFLPSHF